MHIKRIVCLLLSVLMLFVFSACSQFNSASATKKAEATVSDSEENTARFFDENSTAKGNTVQEKTTVAAPSGSESTEKDNNKKPSASVGKSENTVTAKRQASKSKPKEKTTAKQTAAAKKTFTCTISIECSTILKHMDDLDSDKADLIPSNGILLSARKAEFSKGDSVFDVLQRVCRQNGIQMEASWTGTYNSAYIEGINNIYELDCGPASGWMYQVNGWYPNYGCSRYQLKQGDVIKFRYTCNYGKDIGGDFLDNR